MKGEPIFSTQSSQNAILFPPFLKVNLICSAFVKVTACVFLGQLD